MSTESTSETSALAVVEDASGSAKEKRFKKCEVLMDKAMSDPYVAFIREAMAAKGCFAGRDFFKCVDCNNPAVGAAFIYPSSQDSNSSSSQNDNGKFLRHGGDQGVPTHVKDLDLATPQIVMCCDSKLLDFPFEFTRTVSHELIHAFDFCRAKLDVNKLEQHACTEIRASALSQECSISMELLRSNFNLRKQYQECVKRRATLSVLQNPACESEEQAKAIVGKVFDICYKDTSPFERIPP